MREYSAAYAGEYRQAKRKNSAAHEAADESQSACEPDFPHSRTAATYERPSLVQFRSAVLLRQSRGTTNFDRQSLTRVETPVVVLR